MTPDRLKKMERNVSLLQKLLSDLGNASAFAEFLKNIHRPGFTTPAEFRFVSGIVDSLTAQTKVLQGLQRNLLAGARMVR